MRFILLIFLTILTGPSNKSFGQKTPVEQFGRLSIKGNRIFSEYGDTVQLKGMSLFWSQWMDQYYNPEVVKWLKNDWKCTIVRVAMGVESGGYIDNSEEEIQKVITVVDAAIHCGIYVIIDYHSHEAHLKPDSAEKFFAFMAYRYKQYPNVLYEIFNEPLQNHHWENNIKPYAERIIKVIRQYDKENIIIVGSRQWSQKVGEIADNPIKQNNIAYTLHFYAATHDQWLRDEAKYALDKGMALIVTEFGTADAENKGTMSVKATETWLKFLNDNKISWCNWAVSDKEEPNSALLPGASGRGRWAPFMLSPSGQFIRNVLRGSE